MSQIVLPLLFTVFVWWFATGVILYLDGLRQRTFKWTMAGASVLCVAGLVGLNASSARWRSTHASTSSDDQGITRYRWNFGDGKSGRGLTVSHKYPSAGTYTVTLTVRDASDQTDTDTAEVSVSRQ